MTWFWLWLSSGILRKLFRILWPVILLMQYDTWKGGGQKVYSCCLHLVEWIFWLLLWKISMHAKVKAGVFQSSLLFTLLSRTSYLASNKSSTFVGHGFHSVCFEIFQNLIHKSIQLLLIFHFIHSEILDIFTCLALENVFQNPK